jgi:hypothetical protein
MATSRSTNGLAVVSSLAALCLALDALGMFGGAAGEGLGRTLRLALAAPLLLGGVALPWLVRLAPAEPSPLKLAVFGALGSVPSLAALDTLATLALGRGPSAGGLVYGFVALSQLLLLGRRIGRAPLGRAAWSVVALALGCAACVAWVLFGGESAPLLARPEVLWHAGIVDRIVDGGVFGARGAAQDHPWLAGMPLTASPAVAALVAAVVLATGLAAPSALGALTVLAALLSPLLVYIVSAAVWREPRRDVGAVLLVLIGWNALGGLLPFSPPDTGPESGAAPLDWARTLARATPFALRGEVHYGGSAWLVPGALPLALVYALGALAAGVHAVRHGARPWPLLAALSTAVTALVHPVLGTAVGAALVVAALAFGPTSKTRLTLAIGVAVAFLPAVASVARYGLFPEPASPLRPGAGAAAFLVPAALLAAPVVAAAVVMLGAALRARNATRAGGASTPSPERAAVLLLVCAAITPVGVLLALPEGGHFVAALGALAALPLAVVAAGALGRLLAGSGDPSETRARGLRRAEMALGAGLALALGVGGLRATGHAARAHAARALERCPLATVGSRTTLRSPVGLEADLARCYAWVAAEVELGRKRAVLVRFAAPGAPRIGGPTAPHIGPLATGLPLWWDAPPGLVAGSGTGARGDGWRARGSMLAPLFTERYDWDVNIAHLFRALGRPLVFVVDEFDRSTTSERGVGPRGIDKRLVQLGAREVFQAGDASVLLLEPEAVR